MLVPVCAPAEFVTVITAPAPVGVVSVTLWVTSRPFVNTALVPMPEVPVRFDDTFTVPVNAALVVMPAVRFDDTSTVPVKPVTVLLLASCAVIRTLNGAPAACVPIGPLAAASTRK